MKKPSIHRAKEVLSATKGAIRALESSLPSLVRAAGIISENGGSVVVTGIGKSGFIGHKIAATLTSLGQRAYFMHPVEAAHGDIGALRSGDTLLALSYSGESKEVIRIASYAKKHFNVPVVAITKNGRSSLEKIADAVIEIRIASEGSPNGMAPMASTTATLILGDMLSALLMRDTFKDEHFARLHPAGALGFKSKNVRERMRNGSDVPKVKESDSFLRAIREISNKKLGITAVVDTRGKITGVITDGDIRRFILKNKNIQKTIAKDVMTAHPKCVQATDSIEHALSVMEQHKITSMFVTNQHEKIIGIIHIHDILEHMAF